MKLNKHRMKQWTISIVIASLAYVAVLKFAGSVVFIPDFVQGFVVGIVLYSAYDVFDFMEV